MKNRMLLVTVAIKSEKKISVSKINITSNISCKCNLLLIYGIVT